MDSKYLIFTEYDNLVPRKTKIINIESKFSLAKLGQIKWFSSWRKYCFFPNPETVFDLDCLGDIGNYIDKLMEERKNAK